MTRSPRRRLLVLALLALLALPAAAQAYAPGRYHVKSFDYVTVRNAPSAYVIANLYRTTKSGPNAKGNYIDLVSFGGNWGYGRIGDPANAGNGVCGWVLMPQMRRTTKPVGHAGCPDPNGLALAPSTLFAPDSYYRGCDRGNQRRGCAGWAAVTVACANPRAYGNYDPVHGFRNRYGVEPANRGRSDAAFGYRYRTKDGAAVLVKDTSSPAGGQASGAKRDYNLPKWFFLHADCVRRI